MDLQVQRSHHVVCMKFASDAVFRVPVSRGDVICHSNFISWLRTSRHRLAIFLNPEKPDRDVQSYPEPATAEACILTRYAAERAVARGSVSACGGDRRQSRYCTMAETGAGRAVWYSRQYPFSTTVGVDMDPCSCVLARGGAAAPVRSWPNDMEYLFDIDRSGTALPVSRS